VEFRATKSPFPLAMNYMVLNKIENKMNQGKYEGKVFSRKDKIKHLLEKR